MKRYTGNDSTAKAVKKFVRGIRPGETGIYDLDVTGKRFKRIVKK